VAKHSKKKLNPFGKIHGGKCYLARRLIQLTPDLEHHGITCLDEPYGGLASWMLNLEPPTREHPRMEVYNDINGMLNNMMQVLQQHPLKLQRALAVTPYSKQEFLRAKAWEWIGHAPLNVTEQVEAARQTFVLLQQSQGGRMEDWSKTKARTRRGIADVVSGWLAKIHEDLPAIAQRITEWQWDDVPALECMRYYDSTTTMHYCDPPYLPETRTTPKVYKYEMTYEEHEELLQCIVELDGYVMISGYDSALYRRYLKRKEGWYKTKIDMANHSSSAKKKERRIECVWTNYQPPKLSS
jgi:DNA adenine methylase